ncbi:putative Zn(II)2Cys6 transcription factor [Pestalotiopsis sp. NC0098]|nr:putative Zn(II)2Cys6 transcription factor [Pestalotiopsis sp. NC0098]
MIRRQHKKSRNGCSECKRRHIRCDEQRPTCINCTKAERACSYTTEENHEQQQSPSRDEYNATETPRDRESEHGQQQTSVISLNMAHMELIVHFSFDIFVPEFDQAVKEPATKLMLQTALKAPFLMHEILAISACHLSITRPDDSARYRSQAVQLQTKAIELFNVSTRQADRDNTCARILFSSILGRHILADALDNHGLSFSSFLDRYVQGIRIYRGVRAVVAEEDWNVLMGSELGPLMDRGRLGAATYDRPYEALNDTFWQLIFHSQNLNDEERSSCETALRLIETGFANLRDPARSEAGQRMIFLWSIMLPDLFIDLLAHQVSEAIAIFGRYAILLHYGSTLWQVGDAGPRLLHSIKVLLGPGWDEWLAWPMDLQNPTVSPPGTSFM